ncbi:MAG: hypothetical protein HN353_11895 [Bdellovibrionales bacterium]|jgi:hypothetical protein|nr:hypothetical protein [Bdellovibrionales bacterium]MBT3526852.1 hypothetical protein [Bdellovibrionales bacterium]MBT7767798.1 hypothetical protein [Bdellovibrionales bacterium]
MQKSLDKSQKKNLKPKKSSGNKTLETIIIRKELRRAVKISAIGIYTLIAFGLGVIFSANHKSQFLQEILQIKNSQNSILSSLSTNQVDDTSPLLMMRENNRVLANMLEETVVKTINNREMNSNQKVTGTFLRSNA